MSLLTLAILIYALCALVSTYYEPLATRERQSTFFVSYTIPNDLQAGDVPYHMHAPPYDIRGCRTGRYSTSIAHGLPDVADGIDGAREAHIRFAMRMIAKDIEDDYLG